MVLMIFITCCIEYINKDRNDMNIPLENIQYKKYIWNLTFMSLKFKFLKNFKLLKVDHICHFFLLLKLSAAVATS